MKPAKIATLLALTLGLSATTVFAQDAVSQAVKARQAQMALFGYNLGQLGGMAKGAIAYDADAARAAAGNLVSLTAIDGRSMWVADSDEMSADNTRAKSEIWNNFADFGAKFSDLRGATVAMEAASGEGLDALRGAIGGLGGACGACHKVYRAPKN